MGRPGRKRLAMDVSTSTFNKMKECADHQGQTITVYVTRAILEKIKREYGDKEMVKALK